ncbi:hypothetical protein [Candidatus Hepatobacter penaei]|uniref:hypothetical protein n=1 Tax=Candidatus Hepatobacter penaei TaxID=1274402 RepID=UPI0012E053B3|nr:hypothetical protein [Candidatus Hepatobacter penaei]
MIRFLYVLGLCVLVKGLTALPSLHEIPKAWEDQATFEGVPPSPSSYPPPHRAKKILSAHIDSACKHEVKLGHSLTSTTHQQDSSWLPLIKKTLVAPLNGMHTVATYIASPTKLLSLFIFSSFLSHGLGHKPSRAKSPGTQFLTFRYDNMVSLSCEDIDDKPWCDYNIGFSRTDDVDILLRTLTTRDIERSMNFCKSHGCADMELDTYKGGPSILHCSCCDSHHDVLSVLLPETSSSQTLSLI